MNWFKLVGATGHQVAEDWEHDDAENFVSIRFPWSKPPSRICLHDRVVLYAVGDGVLMATQRVIGEPGIKPRRGPKGSQDDRWPHTLDVETLFYCSPLSTAPKLRDVAPDVADKYEKKFWNGSHWRITDEEYEQLAHIVEEAGRSHG
jgi:hypothetical protein